MYDTRTDSMLDFESTLKKVTKKFNNSLDKFDITNRDITTNIASIGNLIKGLQSMQDKRPVDMNEIYAGIKILRQADKKLADQLEQEIQELTQ